jgi:hypothetical protein
MTLYVTIWWWWKLNNIWYTIYYRCKSPTPSSDTEKGSLNQNGPRPSWYSNANFLGGKTQSWTLSWISWIQFIYFIKIHVNTVKCMSDYRRGLDWCLDLLTTYTLTTRDYTLQITDTHRLVFSVITISTIHCLVTASNSVRSPSSEFPNYPRDSATSFSQQQITKTKLQFSDLLPSWRPSHTNFLVFY